MREIDLQTWPRREHFNFFRNFHDPHFNLCANVDLTALHPAVKQRGVPVNTAIVYVLARASNDIPEFRRRIRDETVVEHEIVHPSSTIMVNEDVFTFCTFEYTEDFSVFSSHVAERIAETRENPSLASTAGQDDLLYMTAIPWVSFTSFSHPVVTTPPDSIPRLAWGRFYEDGDLLKMPLSVQGHHALMDGIHVGQYYEGVQAYLSDPDAFIS